MHLSGSGGPPIFWKKGLPVLIEQYIFIYCIRICHKNIFGRNSLNSFQVGAIAIAIAASFQRVFGTLTSPHRFFTGMSEVNKTVDQMQKWQCWQIVCNPPKKLKKICNPKKELKKVSAKVTRVWFKTSCPAPPFLLPLQTSKVVVGPGNTACFIGVAGVAESI